MINIIKDMKDSIDMFGLSAGSGSRISRWGGEQPSMRALFGESVCGNKRIGSRLGGTPLGPPMFVIVRHLPFVVVTSTDMAASCKSCRFENKSIIS